MTIPVPTLLKINVQAAISGWEARTSSMFEGAWWTQNHDTLTGGFFMVRWRHRTGRKNWVCHFGTEDSEGVSQIMKELVRLCRDQGYTLNQILVAQNSHRLILRLRTPDGISIHSSIDPLITLAEA